jgi:P-type Ca2+ transporter type 2C
MEEDGIAGLSDEEAAGRLKSRGYNEIPSAERRNIFGIAFEIIKEPMFLLLIVGGLIYWRLGDVEGASMLLFFVFIVLGITFYQERKTERALEALRDMSSPRALVIRGGRHLRIAGREVVPGDIIVLSEGDRIPADAALLVSGNLQVDESLLTGESVPVRKIAGHGEERMGRPGGDDQPFVYSGTLVVQGRGVAKVLSTGVDTEMGKIGKSLREVETEDTPLQKEMGSLVKRFASAGLLLCAAMVVVYGLTKHDWTGGLLGGIALAMAILPEEIPVVLTIFFAIGAWRMSKRNVLTRRLQSVEALGAATVLCVDKTGTITLNQMTVTKVYSGGGFCDVGDAKAGNVPERFHEVIEYGLLSSQKDPFDPMEKGIKALGDRVLSGTEHIHLNWTLVHEYPLSKSLLSLSNVWKSPDGADYIIAAKGAPEAIADLCHMDERRMRQLSENISSMAGEGLRLLGVAKANFKGDLPPGQHDFNFEFVGLLGFTDPIRDGIADAVGECYDAGIRVVMITGDYSGTAQNIARQIGLKNPLETITGPELEKMEDGLLRERVKSVNVFARVVPEQKLLLVNALKANGEVVAMTGDGVNDAPALKSAHIGVAMGGRGTDVARESAALVLLDDDFSSIVSAVRMGRRIFDNLRKAIAYILAVHIPIAGMSLLPVVMRWPLALMPAHIAFLELIIDPACSTVFEAEPEEDGIMRRPPRRLGQPLFTRRDVVFSVLQGVMVLLIVANIYAFVLLRGGSEEKARALAFTALVISNLGLILTNRSWSRTFIETLKVKNKALVLVLLGAVVCLSLVLYVPFLTALFKFETPHMHDFALAVAAGIGSVLWFECLKILNRRWRNGIFSV